MEGEAVSRHRTFIVASAGYETQIRIFDQSMQLVRSLQFPDSQLLHLAFSGTGPASINDRLLLAAAGSPKIGVYDISMPGATEMPFFMYEVHQGPVTAVGFEPTTSEFMFSSSEDGTLRVFEPVTPLGGGVHRDVILQQPPNNIWRMPTSLGTKRTYFNSGNSGLVAINDVVYFPPQMLYFTVDAIGRLRIWNHDKKPREKGLRAQFRPSGTDRHLQCVDLSSDFSTVVMANLDGFVFIYRVHDLLHGEGAFPAIIRPSNSYVPRVRLSHSCSLLACPLTKDGIKVFRMRDIVMDAKPVGEEALSALQKVAPLQQFGDRPGWIWDVSFVGDSEEYLVACSSNTQTMLWNLKDMSQSTEFPPSRKAVICVAVKEIVFEQPYPVPEVNPAALPPHAAAAGPPHG